MLGEFVAAVLIIRPVNAFIVALSVALGVWLAQPVRWAAKAWFAVAGAVLILAGANVINDYFDVEIDRINRPRRMLPSGRLQCREALALAIFLFVCGNFFSILAGAHLAVLAMLTTLLLVWYSVDLKRRPAVGNAAVSAAAGMAFLFGATAGGDWRAGLVPAIFAFLFHFGREIVKDIEDRLGDARGQARTLPLVYGLGAARWAAAIAFLALLVLTPVPFLLHYYDRIYLFIILAGVYPVVLFALYKMWKDPSVESMRRLSALLKADMVVGLAAILGGR